MCFLCSQLVLINSHHCNCYVVNNNLNQINNDKCEMSPFMSLSVLIAYGISLK